MAGNQKREELILPMNWDILDASSGFTVDIGGSVFKLAYIAKDDWVEPEKRKRDSKGNLHLVNFSRDELGEAIEYINKHAKIIKKSPTTQVEFYSTGLGGQQFSKVFKEKLNAVNNNLPEIDSFVKCFIYFLKEYPRKDILRPIFKPAFEAAKIEALQTIMMVTKLRDVTGGMAHVENNEQPTSFEVPQEHDLELNGHKPMMETSGVLPCLLIVCGSAISFIHVNPDCSFAIFDISTRGGKMLLGLGSLMTDTKNYSELMSLCESGNAQNVSTTDKSIAKTMEKSDKDSMYSVLLENDKPASTIFSFGDATGKSLGDFKKNDLARCLLETVVSDLSQLSYYASNKVRVNHVFFSGGIVNNPLVRQLITTDWLRRDLMNTHFDPEKEKHTQVHFLQYDQSLGAIGAFINHKLKWSEQNKPPQPGGPPKDAKAGGSDYKKSLGI